MHVYEFAILATWVFYLPSIVLKARQVTLPFALDEPEQAVGGMPPGFMQRYSPYFSSALIIVHSKDSVGQHSAP